MAKAAKAVETETVPETETKDTVKIHLVPLDVRHVNIEIVGISPLVVNNWSKKSRDQIKNGGSKAPPGQPKPAREPRNPERDYQASLYPMENGKYGFPAIAFKKAMVRAGTYTEDKMTFLRGAFFVDGTLIEINGEPHMREDIVRVGIDKPDMRWRAEFWPWSMILPITYNARVISVAQIANLIMTAGFSVGVGEGRPEKDRDWGRFELKGQ